MTREELLKFGRWLSVGCIGAAGVGIVAQLPAAGLIAPWLFLLGIGGLTAVTIATPRRRRGGEQDDQAGMDSSR